MKRKSVGKAEVYHGHRIQPAFMGPDLVCYVDDTELPNFYLDAEAARRAGRQYVDEKRREQQLAVRTIC